MGAQLPLRFLPGDPVFKWRRRMWFPAFALAIFGYPLILMDPVNGYLSDNSRTPLIVGVTFFVIFGQLPVGAVGLLPVPTGASRRRW